MDTEDLSERLRKLGLVPTIQRLAVLDYLDQATTHPTAEEVYTGVRDRYPSIAKATVYNALDALKKAGAIRELTIDRGVARYDRDPHPHPHFLCRICGKLYDVDFPCPVQPGDEVSGHKVESVHTYLYGVCAQCRKKMDLNKNESKISLNAKGKNDA